VGKEKTEMGLTRKQGGEGSGNCYGTQRINTSPGVAEYEAQLVRCRAGQHEWKHVPAHKCRCGVAHDRCIACGEIRE
jgi:hypothetical protein